MKAALEEQERKNRPRSFINRNQAQAGSARDVSSKKTELMDGHGVMELPPPVAKGWMMKRGEHNSSWKRRYFALIDPPEDMGLGTALYYFESERLMNKMMELGEQTQKGQLFLEAVQSVSISQDRSDGDANIELNCDDRKWVFRPENSSSFQAWMNMLEKYTKKEQVRKKSIALSEISRTSSMVSVEGADALSTGQFTMPTDVNSQHFATGAAAAAAELGVEEEDVTEGAVAEGRS